MFFLYKTTGIYKRSFAFTRFDRMYFDPVRLLRNLFDKYNDSDPPPPSLSACLPIMTLQTVNSEFLIYIEPVPKLKTIAEICGHSDKIGRLADKLI
ncbi:hypothetical protein LEP1GSC060_0768 [Leptospira weilii serovar Ranarum str. ICFT]|uniref:Uncharacterized protein n=1 Tax=Leptospira weilii serovar Ranarum str. ICFT TaxID=1218598 RepID=N1WH51_9LEPT|nr:hypothetical protein LEP1GSC060_0768 [Leptospira weilii serovar Ranarum str. ICFT]